MNAYDLENQLISRVFKDGNLSFWDENGLTEKDFGSYPDTYKMIRDFVDDHGCIPSEQTYQHMLNLLKDKGSTEPDSLHFYENLDSDEVLISSLTEWRMYTEYVDVVRPNAEKMMVDEESEKAFRYLFDSAVAILKKFKNKKDTGSSIKEIMHQHIVEPPTQYISTSFKEIDEILEGGIPTDDGFCVFMAGTGIGKTWTLCKIAAHHMKEGKKVLFINTEMSKKEIAFRISSFLSSASHKDIKKKIANVETVSREVDDVMGDCIITDPPCSESDLSTASISGWIDTYSPDIILLDDVVLMCRGDAEDAGALTAKIKRSCAYLRGISIENKIPIICSAQPNRSGARDGSIPTIFDIADSFGVVQTASVVLIAYKNDLKDFSIYVGKSREVGAQIENIKSYTINFNTGEYKIVDGVREAVTDAMKEMPKDAPDLWKGTPVQQRRGTARKPIK